MEIARAGRFAFELLEAHDFSWLSRFGEPFCVFDRQDSGNVCFGVTDGNGDRLFVKYAGARPALFSGYPRDAISSLRNAMPLYERLAHPALTRLLGHGPVGQGYAAVFAWAQGETLRPREPYKNPAASPRARLRRRMAITRLKMLDQVFDFHAQAAALGYVAVDFYDGNVLVDLDAATATVCDIDLYRQKPAYNDIGRMPGSSRFMSPEEYQLGAALDETTNVYAMGALAFEFFGSNQDRSLAAWEGAPQLHAVAARATRPERDARYPTLADFLTAWRAAVGRIQVW